jgi:hypothetical protein
MLCQKKVGYSVTYLAFQTNKAFDVKVALLSDLLELLFKPRDHYSRPRNLNFEALVLKNYVDEFRLTFLASVCLLSMRLLARYSGSSRVIPSHYSFIWRTNLRSLTWSIPTRTRRLLRGSLHF